MFLFADLGVMGIPKCGASKQKGALKKRHMANVNNAARPANVCHSDVLCRLALQKEVSLKAIANWIG